MHFFIDKVCFNPSLITDLCKKGKGNKIKLKQMQFSLIIEAFENKMYPENIWDGEYSMKWQKAK